MWPLHQLTHFLIGIVAVNAHRNTNQESWPKSTASDLPTMSNPVNLTLMLASLSDWSNHSPATRPEFKPEHYTQLVEMLQRLNESQLFNLSKNQLVSDFLNASEQDHIGLQPSNQSTQEPIGLWLRIVLYALYAAICVLGVCGNSLVR